MTEGRLDELVPIENAAMEDRTVIGWDKDDIDALGILKVDVLALGMLTCIRKGFELLAAHHGTRYTLATLPAEDPAVYDMLCRADSLGVFQVESRAQMNILPRLRPRCFYDLVIEVAIVRPGPIQGDMVHPYLRRRARRGEGRVPVGRARRRARQDARRAALPGAGDADRDHRRRLLAEEADQLRRALATFKKTGTIHTFRERFLAGMAANGYPREFAERCFSQIEGFGEYGFPESHAASFALLVYASAWLKCHHPAVFACALLNSQPMGFYAPAQIVRDARAHGVVVRPVCVNASYWDNVLEPDGRGGLALRLGFRQIKGMREDEAGWIAAARGNGYRDVGAGLAPRRHAAGAARQARRRRRLRELASQPARGALAGQGDRRRRAPAALRRARGRGRGGAGRAAADDARRGDRRRLHRAPPDAQGAPDGADPAPAVAAARRTVLVCRIRAAGVNRGRRRDSRQAQALVRHIDLRSFGRQATERFMRYRR